MLQRSNDIHERLIDRCRAGDRQAQFDVYKQYSKAMLNTAQRIVGNIGEAEDVLQDAFLDAFTKIDLFRGESTFGAWLKRIVVNKSINMVNKRKMQLVDMENADLNGYGNSETQPELEKSMPLTVENVMKALDNLPDGYRIVFSLYCLEGYDHKEIGAILGISESGSKTQYLRAKKKLQDILTEKSYV
jgi:RNA polymerase sigma-70 factor (ECF subfamily)